MKIEQVNQEVNLRLTCADICKSPGGHLPTQKSFI